MPNTVSVADHEPIEIDMVAVKAAAKQKLKDKAFKQAVALQVEKEKAKRQHILPWKMRLQWPISLHDHYTGEKV